MVAEFMLAQTRGLPIVSQAVSMRSFAQLREDERAIAQAGLIAERVDRMTAEDQAQPEVFDLLVQSLDLLNRGVKAVKVGVLFDHLFLGQIGFRPDFSKCAGCGAILRPESNAYNIDLGGILCQQCAANQPGSRPISVDALKVMRLIDRGDLGRYLGTRIDDPTLIEASSLLTLYIDSLSGRESGATRVIRELRLEYNHLEYDSAEDDDHDVSHRSSRP